MSEHCPTINAIVSVVVYGLIGLMVFAILMEGGALSIPDRGAGWFYAYQTLFSGGLALFGGYLAYRGVFKAHDLLRARDVEERVVLMKHLERDTGGLISYISEYAIKFMHGDDAECHSHIGSNVMKDGIAPSELFRNDLYLTKLNPLVREDIRKFVDLWDDLIVELEKDADDVDLDEVMKLSNYIWHDWNVIFHSARGPKTISDYVRGLHRNWDETKAFYGPPIWPANGPKIVKLCSFFGEISEVKDGA